MVEGGYRLSATQAQAILDLRLHRLTGLEQEKIINEYKDLLGKIKELSNILEDPDELLKVIRGELTEVRDNFGDARRTEIVKDHSDLNIEDLIPNEEVVVTLSHGGYAKAQPVDDYRAQKRGGRGRSATKVKDEDFIDKLFIANTHDTILCFSNHGKAYWLKVYQVPQASRGSRGKPIVNLLPLEEGERINAVLPIREFSEDKFVFMATADGTVKKTSLMDFSRPRASGIRAIELLPGNHLIDVELTDGNQDAMLFSDAGKVIRFKESEVRAMGRTAKGVRGIRLATGQQVISLIIVEEDTCVLTATWHGYGKRTSIADYPVQARGGQGVISIQTSDRNGAAVGAVLVREEDEIMLISDHGTLIRTPVGDVSVMGRNTQGVRLVSLSDGEKLAGLERIVEYGENGENGDE
jgi:DNA gyrase subunit A